MNWLNDKGKRDGKLLKALGALRPFIEAGMRKRNELYAPEPEVEEQGLTARRQKRNTNKNPFRSVESYLGYKVGGLGICDWPSDIEPDVMVFSSCRIRIDRWSTLACPIRVVETLFMQQRLDVTYQRIITSLHCENDVWQSSDCA